MTSVPRNTAFRYLETAAVTAAACLPLHYLADLEWPRALAVGLVAAIVGWALVSHRQLPCRKLRGRVTGSSDAAGLGRRPHSRGGHT
jgi:hypothetical protein